MKNFKLGRLPLAQEQHLRRSYAKIFGTIKHSYDEKLYAEELNLALAAHSSNIIHCKMSAMRIIGFLTQKIMMKYCE